MESATTLFRCTVPWGRQEIELQELRFEAGGAPLLRLRIREAKRFTIFDIDAATAARWGDAMAEWGRGQLAEGGVPAGVQGHDEASGEAPHPEENGHAGA